METLTTKGKQTVNRLVLANGITLILIENQAADVIAGRIFLKNSGSRWESRQKAGLSHLLSSVITKGTQRLSSAQIADRVESVGANLGTDSAADYMVMSLKTVSADFSQIFHLAAEILRSPVFPESEIELEKKLTLQGIKSQLEQPFNVAFNRLREAMYPQHPYGVSILGIPETVTELTREDLLEFHQNHFRPDNLVISIAGRLTLDQAVHLVEEVFGDWQKPDLLINDPQICPLQNQPSKHLIPQETQQSIIMLGYLTSNVKDPDYAALKLLNTYLGNGLSSRLFVELREKRGLAYDVSAFYPTRLDLSQFVVYIGTAPINTAIAFEGLATEVNRLREVTLSPLEIKASQNKLLGQYALGKQTNAELSQIFGWYESLGLGIGFDSQFQDDVMNVTAEKAQEVACRYFGEPYISIVGPEAVISHQ
jgi:predicted Zn-dependent peptidase